MWVIAPIVAMVLFSWYFLVGQYQVRGQDRALGLAVTPVTTKSVVNVLGGGVSSVMPTRGQSVKCYALRNTKSISGTVVYAQSMLIADGYTRAMSGMVRSPKTGWISLIDFACQGDLLDIEVEYFGQDATPTPRKIVSVVTRVVTPVPSVTSVPSATPGYYGPRFDKVSDCEYSWLVRDVSQVWFIFDGKRIGVAGDSAGLPVVKSVCPYTGSVTLWVLRRDGSSLSLNR